jgi:anti-sigma factor ChrR (cupin superfamily)
LPRRHPHPVGTSHSSWSDDGCDILVKLMQMDPNDQERVVIDTGSGIGWVPSGLDGIDRLPLHEFASEKVWLARFQPGAVAAEHDHPGGEEEFVLDGTLEDEDGVYPRGTWLRLPVGSRHHPRAPAGCLLYVKSGHLAPPPE